MTMTVLRTPRRAAVAALTGLALLLVAGCGGDEASSTGSTGKSLARFAPASSPLYLEAAVRPDGDQKSDLDALIQKFAPGQSLDTLTQKAFASGNGSDKVDFDRDVKPWLGKRAGIALTGIAAGGKDADVAAFVETTDGDKALATLRKSASGKVDDRNYNGQKYIYDEGEKDAAAIVDDTLLIGTEPALKAAIDTSKGSGLDDNAKYAKVVGAVSDDALGFVYGNLSKVIDLAGTAGQGAGVDAKTLESFRELLNRQGISTFAAAVQATGDTVRIRSAADAKATADPAASAETLAALPAGSWAAFGLGDLGKSISDGLDALKGVAVPGFDVQGGLAQLKQQAGIDVQKDLLSWMGTSGLFVRGTSITDIGGALVVESKDTAATKAALSKARTILAGAKLPAQELKGKGVDDGFSVTPGGAPVQVFAALAGKRFVLALNRASFDEAIDPTSKLGDDDAFKAAADTLGDGFKPSFFLDFPKVAGLISAFGGGQPGFAQVQPYLQKIGTIVSGAKRDGDLSLQSLAVQVK